MTTSELPDAPTVSQSNGEFVPLTPTEQVKWLTVEYYRSLSAHVSDGQRYFNQLLSWSNSLILANVLAVGVSVVVGEQKFSSDILAGIGFFMLTLLHYLALRAARGYTNLIRFSSIQKEITSWILKGASEKELPGILANIQTYHIEWTSPLSKIAVLQKVWLSSGLVFHALVILVMIVLSLKIANPAIPWPAYIAIMLIANLVIFIKYFTHSRYFKVCKDYKIAKDQA